MGKSSSLNPSVLQYCNRVFREKRNSKGHLPVVENEQGPKGRAGRHFSLGKSWGACLYRSARRPVSGTEAALHKPAHPTEARRETHIGDSPPPR